MILEHWSLMMNKLDALELSKKLNNMVITSSEFTKAYDGITSCSAQTRAYQKPIGSLLIAEGGLGKTTLSQSILKKNPCYEKQEDGYTKRVVPVFYIQIPSPATVKSVAGMMLKALNDPAPLSGTTAQMTERLCYLLKLCETELILMDEFHHLFDMQKVSRKMNIDVCNWIKTVTDSTNISSCLIGLPEFAPLLQIDSQLARRFPLTFKLSRLNIGSTQLPGTLYGFLSQVEQNIEKRLTLKFLPRLINPLFVLQIYASTKGYHHYIISLIREALLFALLADSDVITQQHFSLAWDKGITSYTNMTTQNPFHMDTSKLVQRMKGDH